MNGPYNNIFSLCYYIATYYMQRERNILFSTKAKKNDKINLSLIDYYQRVALVIIYSVLFNPQVTNAQVEFKNFKFPSMLVGTSETVRMFSICSTLYLALVLAKIRSVDLGKFTLAEGKFAEFLKKGNDGNNLKIRQWIAGIIDGDGNFYISKKGYVELSVVMETRDIACLYKLKQWYGGSVKATSYARAVRFRLHHMQGILHVIKDINGLIQNPVRYLQFQKVCNIYNISVLPSVPLKYDSAYLSGLFDSDGSVYYNIQSMQVFITVTQKNRELLDKLVPVYGGVIRFSNKNHTCFKWTISKKYDIINLINNYFHWNNCVSAKNKKLGLVKQFYFLSSIGALKAPKNSVLGKSLTQLVNKWEST